MSSRDWLDHLEQFGIKLGLSSISAIARELGHPERGCPVVHVAGTNGKGSVSAMVAHALSCAGHRTGLYTSPHLVRLEERFRIDGRPIDPSRLDEVLADVRAAVDRLTARGALEAEPTFFEATTAAALVAFRRARVDVAVIEVGLGGRLDATNIVSPVATAITSIDFDHQAQLGPTLDAIAVEKAGIIKRGVPVVVGPMSAEARGPIDAAARERAAPLLAPAPLLGREPGPDGHEVVTLAYRTESVGPVRLALAGGHQAGNAAIATRLVEIVDAAGLPVGAASVREALRSTRWPARMQQVVTPAGRAIVDGAHNPAGARALSSYLQRRFPAGLPMVFGAMRDKSLAPMVEALLPVARPFVFTRVPGAARSAEPRELAAILREVARAAEVEMHDELEAALAAAWRRHTDLVVAGSLYLAGAALAHLGVPVD